MTSTPRRLAFIRSSARCCLTASLPVYHLYYGSKNGDASTIITTFPFKKPGIFGRRGTNQTRTIMQAIPVGAADFWVDRLNEHGIPATKGDRFGLTRVMFAHPCGIPHELVENPDDTRAPIVNEAQGITAPRSRSRASMAARSR